MPISAYDGHGIGSAALGEIGARYTSATGRHLDARATSGEGHAGVQWGGVPWGDLWIHVVSSTHGLQITLEPPPDEYLVVIPEEGTAELAGDQVSTPLIPGASGAILSLPRSVEWRSAGATSTTLLRVSRVALEAHAEQLAEAPLQRPIVFTPRMNIASGYTGCLARAIQSVLSDTEGGAPSVRRPKMIRAVRDTILAWLLVGQANNNADRFEASPRAEDRAVRCAEDYIDAHLDDLISMPDLARVANVSVRTLQSAFKRHRGVSPLLFLKERRLSRARDLLLAGAAGVRVTDVALQCGFNHLGQFSVDYRRRFGEKPVDTLRKHRSLRAP